MSVRKELCHVRAFGELLPSARSAFGFERSAMQNANIIHNISALILVTIVLAHIYLGTLGSEGALEGMLSGEVDEGWARQHHNVWLEGLESGQERPTREAEATGRSATAST